MILSALPQDLFAQDFDWKTGRFRSSFGGLSLWAGLAVHLALGLAVALGPPAALHFTSFCRLGRVCEPESPLRAHLARWPLVFGLGYTMYCLAYALTCAVPLACRVLERSRGRVLRGARRFSLCAVSLASFVGKTGSAVAMSLAVSKVVEITTSDRALMSPKRLVGRRAMQYLLQVSRTLNTLSWRYYVSRAFHMYTAVRTVELLEKIVLQQAALYFHAKSCENRIEENNAALGALRRLAAHHLHGQPLVHEELGGALFDKIVPQDRVPQTIILSDLATVLGPETGRFLYDLVDLDGHGDIERREIALAARQVFQTRTALTKTLADNIQIIDKLDSLLLSLAIVVDFIVCAIIFDETARQYLAAVGGSLLTLAFVFGSSAKTALESIVFVLFSHPFDVGDRVVIDGQGYTVQELGLWQTTLLDGQMRMVYMTNSTLRSASIANIRRSPIMWEVFVLHTSPDVAQEALVRLEARLTDFVVANRRDYVPELQLRGLDVVDKQHMNIEIKVFHRSNFQDGGTKDARTRRFFFAMKEIAEDVGIPLAPPYA